MEGTVPLYHDARAYLYDYASFDQRHALSLNYIWQLPGSRWSHPVVRALISGWLIAGTTSFGTGRPAGVTFSTSDSADILGGGDPGTVRVTCDPNLSRGQRTEERWFDTSCFARPARGDEGNASRRAQIRLPGCRPRSPLAGPAELRQRERRVVVHHQQHVSLHPQPPAQGLIGKHCMWWVTALCRALPASGVIRCPQVLCTLKSR